MTTKPADLEKAGRDQPDEEKIERANQIHKNQAAIDLIRSWLESEDEEDAAEQRETLDYLIRVLDEDRLSDRKFFS